MDTLSVQGIQVAGQNGHQGLAFAGLHFGDTALVQNDAADELNRIRLHAQHPPGSFPDSRKSFGEQIVQCFSLGQTIFKLGGLSLQFFFGKGGIFPFHGQNLIYQRLDLLDLPLGTCTKNFCKKSHLNSP